MPENVMNLAHGQRKRHEEHSHSHYWDGRDGNGSPLVSGVYFVRLFSTEQQASARVVLFR
jgi:hypothetical protein